MMNYILQILGTSGLPGLYRGALYYSTVDGFSGAIFFSTYELVKHHISYHLPESMQGFSGYFCSVVAVLASSVILVPGELIKQRLQSGLYKNLLECLRVTISPQNGGLKGLYTGYKATLFRDIPYFALQLGCYGSCKKNIHITTITCFPICSENIKNLVRHVKKVESVADIGAEWEFIAGLAAGAITGVLTNPMDVITARLMTQKQSSFDHITNAAIGNSRSSMEPALSSVSLGLSPIVEGAGKAAYGGMRQCIAIMMREEGPGAFFLGVGARVSWLSAYTSVYLSMNEKIKRVLLENKKRREKRV